MHAPDAERLVRRLVAGELTPSFVPDAEQRLWRTVTRRKYQLTCNRVQLQNRLEALLEEMHVKLSSLVSDLLGPNPRRMLGAIAEGATDPVAVAALAHQRLRATPEALADALGACAELHPVYRRLLQLTLTELAGIEAQIRSCPHRLATDSLSPSVWVKRGQHPSGDGAVLMHGHIDRPVHLCTVGDEERRSTEAAVDVSCAADFKA